MMMKSGSGDPGKEFGRETKKLEGVARANGKIEGEEAMTQREETVKRRVRRGEMERCVRYEGQRANERRADRSPALISTLLRQRRHHSPRRRREEEEK